MSSKSKLGEVLLYQTEDGQAKINLHAIEGTVWLSQEEIATLFDKGRTTISEHIKNIFSDGELLADSVCRKFRHTAQDGKDYSVFHYNLDMILAIGFRVRSARAVQFRRWANTVLKEYLVKGFAMDDVRLKGADSWDYFDEWLARIRDIRASEKRFYQKVRDLYATAVDYERSSEQAQFFFKKVQNKMLWAVTGKTAAEIIAQRSDSDSSNMGLTAFKGNVVRKGDIGTAKNYLSAEEVGHLNRVVTMYLDYAEEQASRRKTITMAQWENKLDAFLQFNEHELLTHAGKVRMEVAQRLAAERYDTFDIRRRQEEAAKAEAEDLRAVEKIAQQIETQQKDKA